MKQVRTIVARWAGVAMILWAAMWLVGCQAPSQPDYTDIDGLVPQGDLGMRAAADTDVFHVGDVVGVVYAFTVNPPLIPPYDERIRDDGMITPPFVGPVKAAGRMAGDLQKELQEKYEKLYRNIQVTVKTGSRVFYVDGEVVKSGPAEYRGVTDIVQAISAAGGFTEFASKRRVRLIRPNGKTETINYNRAISDPEYKFYVYPGDKVIVPRRWL